MWTGPDHHALGRDSADVVHAFSPMHAAWAPALTFPGGGRFTGACQSVVEDTTTRHAYSARHNAWVAGPAKDPTAIHEIVWGGSAYGARNRSTGELVFWHERADQWISTSLAGTGVPVRAAGRNVLVLDATGLVPAGAMLAFSAQRGDLIAAPGFAGVPLAPAVAEENVAWVRDSAATLHAFASPAHNHTWFQWPLDTEYQVFAPVAGPPVPMRTMIRGNSGDQAFLAIAMAPLFPGLPLPPFGTLRLDPATLVLVLGGGVVGTNGLIGAPIELNVTGGAACLQVWSQGLLFSGGSVTLLDPVPEPAVWF